YHGVCHVIYNGIDRGAIYPRIEKNEPNFRAIIVGSSTYGKGLDIAIQIIEEARKKNNDITLSIIGFPDFDKSSKLPIDGITYIGPVPPGDMNKYYASADLLIFPSRNEGFPLTILEALKNGLPVLVS